jgi:hypothetical protein
MRTTQPEQLGQLTFLEQTSNRRDGNSFMGQKPSIVRVG